MDGPEDLEGVTTGADRVDTWQWTNIYESRILLIVLSTRDRNLSRIALESLTMYEIPAMEIQKIYNMNAQRFFEIVKSSTSTVETLEDTIFILENYCSISSGLCEELSRNAEELHLYKEILNLNRSWADILSAARATLKRKREQPLNRNQHLNHG